MNFIYTKGRRAVVNLDRVDYFVVSTLSAWECNAAKSNHMKLVAFSSSDSGESEGTRLGYFQNESEAWAWLEQFIAISCHSTTHTITGKESVNE